MVTHRRREGGRFEHTGAWMPRLFCCYYCYLEPISGHAFDVAGEYISNSARDTQVVEPIFTYCKFLGEA